MHSDRKEETFWISTGMFPQEFILHVKENRMVQLQKVRIVSSNSL